jgi:hypothetical protein
MGKWNGVAERARRRVMIVVVGSVLSVQGCSQHWVAQSTTNGRAFVARGDTMLYCYVANRPICRPVVESPR